jgi:hypothetical protein
LTTQPVEFALKLGIQSDHNGGSLHVGKCNTATHTTQAAPEGPPHGGPRFSSKGAVTSSEPVWTGTRVAPSSAANAC